MTAVMIESGHLGPVEIDDDSVIEFPAGIIGFPDQRRYAIIAAEETGVYSWLQSLDQPDLAFLALVPAPFFPDYAPVIPDEDCRSIGLTDPADAQVLCLVTVGDDVITANLLGPIVLNVRNRKARQVVLTDSSLSTKAPVLEL
ncbi:MAG TPA: flagellar assembly protein FliW [Microthrixaceae bacterium]|nr:flagellar assembly protein FliW [Microthrixaceae bacterium]